MASLKQSNELPLVLSQFTGILLMRYGLWFLVWFILAHSYEYNKISSKLLASEYNGNTGYRPHDRLSLYYKREPFFTQEPDVFFCCNSIYSCNYFPIGFSE